MNSYERYLRIKQELAFSELVKETAVPISDAQAAEALKDLDLSALEMRVLGSDLGFDESSSIYEQHWCALTQTTTGRISSTEANHITGDASRQLLKVLDLPHTRATTQHLGPFLDSLFAEIERDWARRLSQASRAADLLIHDQCIPVMDSGLPMITLKNRDRSLPISYGPQRVKKGKHRRW